MSKKKKIFMLLILIIFVLFFLVTIILIYNFENTNIQKNYENALKKYEMCQYDESLNMLLKCKYELDKKNDAHDQIFLNIYHMLGKVYLKINNNEQSEFYLTFAITLKHAVPVSKDDIIAADLYKNLGDVYKNQKKFEQALLLYNDSLNIYKEVDDKIEIASYYVNLGKLYEESDHYVDSLENYNIALSILQKNSKNNFDFFDVYYGMAKVYYKKNNYDDAAIYNKKSLDSLEVIDANLYKFALSYNLSSQIFYDQNDYKNSLDYAKKANKIENKIYGKNNSITLLSLNNISKNQYQLKKYNSALKNMNYVLKEAIRLNNANLIFSSYYNISQIYISLGRFDYALDNIMKSYKTYITDEEATEEGMNSLKNDIKLIYLKQNLDLKNFEQWFEENLNKKEVINYENN